MPFDGTTYRKPLTKTEQEAKDDLFLWLDRFPDRVPALLEAVREGRLSWAGVHIMECRCVVFTLGVADPSDPWDGLRDVNETRQHIQGNEFCTPIEDFVTKGLVREGDTPSNSPVMAHLERWIVEWMA